MKSCLVYGALAAALLTSTAHAETANPMVGLFAQDAALSNEFEIAESKIVLQDSTDPQLRAFAERMIHDHGMAQEELRHAASYTASPTAITFDSIRQQKVNDLGLMDGAKLRKAYLEDQVTAHASAAASLSSYAMSGSDPALRTYARMTLPVVLMHQRILEGITGQPKPL